MCVCVCVCMYNKWVAYQTPLSATRCAVTSKGFHCFKDAEHEARTDQQQEATHGSKQQRNMSIEANERRRGKGPASLNLGFRV